jgi:L,D-peptidoglycan transpeptidase YkuD (ErfK/YbiS/YcfS/YnhG family)
VRALVTILAALLLAASLCAAALEPARAKRTTAACVGRGNAIVVTTGSHRLRLCRADQADADFRVALGRGGVDKRRTNDNKTPLGEYALGDPVPSDRFGTFIPVDYPTAAQRKEGHTGGAIGIHGPHRTFRWLGRITTWLEWTRGCVALGRDEDIRTVSRWMRGHQVHEVVIE